FPTRRSSDLLPFPPSSSADHSLQPSAETVVSRQSGFSPCRADLARTLGCGAVRPTDPDWCDRFGRAVMRRRDAVVWRQVVDELANALEVAIGFAAQVRRNAQTTADVAPRLEDSIVRAVSVLNRIQSARGSRKRGQVQRSTK